MIEEVKQIFDDIRDAIIEMGGNIDVCSSPEEYAEAIKELTGNTAVLFIPCFKSSELKPPTPTKTMSPADPTDYPEGWGTPDGLTGKIWMTYTMVSTSTVYVPWTEPVLLGEAGSGPQPSTFDDATTRTFLIFLELPSLNITPTRPIGGNWNTQDNILYNNPTFTYNGVTYTWASDNNHIAGNYTWISQGTFLAETGDIIGAWTNPICINSVRNGRDGKDGRNGQDGTDIEFIYKLAHSEDEGRLFPTPESENIDDYVPGPNPNTRGYWCDHPSGIDSVEYPVEMMCTREKNKETGDWGPFIGPVVWSSWGEDGTDGDGIEYIFRIASNAEVTGPDAQGKYHLIASAWPPTCGEGCTSAYYTVAAGHGYTRDQLTEMYQDDEFIPGNSATAIGWDRNWTDDPLDVSISQPFEFVSVRKFKFNESTEQGEWGWYSEPVLWNKFWTTASPVFTSFVFCRTKQNIGSMALTGGTEFDPLPNTQYWPINDPSDPSNERIEWFDTIPGATEYADDPDPTRFTSPIWMASRIFGSVDPNAQSEDQGWTSPTLIADSKYFNVEYSASNFLTESVVLPEFDATINGTNPFIDDTNEEGVNESAWRTYCRTHDAQGHVVVDGSPTCLGVWGDADTVSNPIWMATCSFGENGWTEWKVTRIEGEAGVDGPGAEYVYIRTNTNVAPTVSSASADSHSRTYVDDEYLPKASGGDLVGSVECTDDPTGVDATHQYEWIAKRVKVFASGSTTDRIWEQYTGSMSLWAKWGEKGDPGDNGRGIVSVAISYMWYNSGTSHPAASAQGWSSSIPSEPSDQTYKYLWKKTVTTYNIAPLTETTYELISERGSRGPIGPKMRMRNWSDSYTNPDSDGQSGWQCGDNPNDVYYDIAIWPNVEGGIDTNVADAADRLWRCTQNLNYANVPSGSNPSTLPQYFSQAVGWDFVATNLLLANKINANQIDVNGLSAKTIVTDVTDGSYVNIAGNTIDLKKNGTTKCRISGNPIEVTASSWQEKVWDTPLGYHFAGGSFGQTYNKTINLGSFTIDEDSQHQVDRIYSAAIQQINLEFIGTWKQDVGPYTSGNIGVYTTARLTARNQASQRDTVWYQAGYGQSVWMITDTQATDPGNVYRSGTNKSGWNFQLDTTNQQTFDLGTYDLILDITIIDSGLSTYFENMELYLNQYSPNQGSTWIGAHSPIVRHTAVSSEIQYTDIGTDGFAHVLDGNNYFFIRKDNNSLKLEFFTGGSYGLRISSSGIEYTKTGPSGWTNLV